ncbi:RNA polymerase sigma-70 factor (sigma-E family) [Amycolatopsis bartoniae]|uniref:RNA polymerase subunit sigma-24 n=1 Tax=Amycolatopsis bartoniae TaxID=941986 RepID=A0A8H9MCA8_9PSEU|nr:SigE family RNA polymerase sigma factor [Amycolatopsis bartoniae]MBB2935746.1 RNA polymerase sigma-70 factor (sigma-E family) [Amycolatopsis bartoniae]TVT05852.1 SigE family RNA polymerase sigma factor [Amycolatopsis bartoniae]GHF61598.1 RNA polymerase subunit sigma-24 [Amycolatopsis bartoniae]
MHFEEFSREHLPGLVRFAAVLTGDRDLAQDVVQDALVRAHQRWRRVSATDRPDLYLRKMVVNGYLSWRRRWYQRSVRPADDVTRLREVATPDPALRIADADQLAVLLAGLSRPQQAAIVLRFYEDRDDGEIAEVLGCAVGTVRSHISRGLAILRGRMTMEVA